jgi:hypothetical protein
MTKFQVTPVAAIQFPDSGWTLTIQRQDSDVVISLHWREKAVPTHQVACTIEEFKMMIDAAGLV